MITLLAFSLLFSSALSFNRREKFDCNNGPPVGTFCENDLSGYVRCSFNVTSQKVINERVTCGKGKKCACFINSACPKKLLKSPCVKRRSITRIAKSFTVDFLETTVIQSRTGRRFERFRTVIRYDGLGERYAEQSTNLLTNQRSFKFIKKNKFGTYLRNTGTYPNFKGVGESCMNKFIREFPKLFPDFDDFNRVSKAFFMETWRKEVGARTIGESAEIQSWTFNTAPIFSPRTAIFRRIGSVISPFNLNRRTDFYLFLPEKHIGDDFFESPLWCSPE